MEQMACLGIHSTEEPITALAFQGGRHADPTSHSDRDGRPDWRYLRRARRYPLRGESCEIHKGHIEGSSGEIDVPEQRAAGRPRGSGPTSTATTKHAERDGDL